MKNKTNLLGTLMFFLLLTTSCVNRPQPYQPSSSTLRIGPTNLSSTNAGINTLPNPTASETSVPGNQLALEVQELSTQWQETNRKAGWIQIVSQWQLDDDNISVAPDGKIMEKEYVNEEWYLLDEQGFKIKFVSIQRDLLGNVIQVAAFRDNAGFNLTYGMRFPELEEPQEFVWDFGFPTMASRHPDSLEKEFISLEGQTGVLYTVIEENQSPIKVANFNEPISAHIKSACFDPESGQLLFLDDVVRLESGAERTFTSIRIVGWETGIQPTAEVLAYLEDTYRDDFVSPSEYYEALGPYPGGDNTN